MAIIALLIFVVILGLGAFLLVGNRDVSRWIQFYARGKDAGFSFREIHLMHKAAVKAALEEPVSLFWSLNQLNECIKGITVRAKLTGQEHHAATQDFLAKLYEFRKKLEFEQPRYRKGIQSSRQIADSQILRILLEGEGVFRAKVLRNTDRHLTVSLPESLPVKGGSAKTGGTEWRGKKISVYFWRIDDAGYVFDSYVLDEVKSTGWPAIQVAHSDSLFRTQKRKSIRTRTSIPAYLYIVAQDDDPHRLETDPGFRCILEDLSEDGCAITVGGKARDGLSVRVQFELSGETLAMGGLVRSSEYNTDTRRSLLHVEAFPLPVHVKNRIQAAVFGIQTLEEMDETFSFIPEDGEGDDQATSIEHQDSIQDQADTNAVYKSGGPDSYKDPLDSPNLSQGISPDDELPILKDENTQPAGTREQHPAE